MPFPTKINDPKLWNTILQEAKVNGAFVTANKYYKELGVNPKYLGIKLQKQLKKLGSFPSDNNDPENFGERKRSSISENLIEKANARKQAYEGIKLTTKEKKLITDIAEGKVDLETASRVIASKAFEKLLKFPDSASFTNFIQSELLKLKRQELTDKNTWAMELVNRMFNGVLPPRVCPGCGLTLVKLPVLEGEIIEDESV